jgi:hypothetical protein
VVVCHCERSAFACRDARAGRLPHPCADDGARWGTVHPMRLQPHRTGEGICDSRGCRKMVFWRKGCETCPPSLHHPGLACPTQAPFVIPAQAGIQLSCFHTKTRRRRMGSRRGRGGAKGHGSNQGTLRPISGIFMPELCIALACLTFRFPIEALAPPQMTRPIKRSTRAGQRALLNSSHVASIDPAVISGRDTSGDDREEPLADE